MHTFFDDPIHEKPKAKLAMKTIAMMTYNHPLYCAIHTAKGEPANTASRRGRVIGRWQGQAMKATTNIVPVRIFFQSMVNGLCIRHG